MDIKESFAYFTLYTQELCRWTLNTACQAVSLPVMSSHSAYAAAQRLARMHVASGRRVCVLLGVGDGAFLTLLAEALPENTPVLVVESDMNTARRTLARMSQRPWLCLLADTSPWALFLLTKAAGLHPDMCTIAWAPAQEHQRVLQTWRTLFLTSQDVALSYTKPLSLSVGCILHPEEPYLQEFFSHIPAWAHEVVAVWDGKLPQPLPICAANIKHIVRTLDGDFSAQRNAMLAHCTGDWCVYLDADERLETTTLEALGRMTAIEKAGAVAFPRITFEGDVQHMRVGYGLWPDVQIRFFPLSAGLHFVNSIHEQLHGIVGDTLLAPTLPIMHYSHIYKNRQALRERLHVFDAASPQGTHVLSQAYPAVPVAPLRQLLACCGQNTVFRLPRM